MLSTATTRARPCGGRAGFLYLADTTQEAREAFGPTYEQIVAYFNEPGNHTPGNEMTFATIDDAIARGPVLVGSGNRSPSATTSSRSARPR